MEFPRFMCRAGGSWQLESGMYSVRTVASLEEYEQALLDGWHGDQYAAKAAHEAAQVIDVEAVEVQEVRPTRRQDLEQKATELGIPFSPRTSDKKLAAEIAAKRTPAEA